MYACYDQYTEFISFVVSRDAQKERNGPVTSTPKTPRQKPKTRKAVDEQRELWRLQKQAQRKKWSAQKWRRHREKTARYKQEKRNEARK